MMKEFYIELQDENGTGYGCVYKNGEEMYFDNIDEARLYAKSRVDETYILARVVDAETHSIVDFYEFRS